MNTLEKTELDPVVLYIEDDENDVIFLRRAIRKAGVAVTLFVATSAEQAMDYLSGAEPFQDRHVFPLPRLVLTDLNLPELSGLDLVAWMRKRNAFANVPAIVMSSSTMMTDVAAAYTLGANGYIIKPTCTTKLVSIVRGLVSRWLGDERSDERPGLETAAAASLEDSFRSAVK